MDCWGIIQGRNETILIGNHIDVENLLVRLYVLADFP
jgi:hypothetical protein